MSERQIEELSKLNLTLKEMSETLYEIRAWYRQTPRSDTKTLLELILDAPKKIMAYQLSTGENTTRTISKITGAGTGSISRWWNDWIEKGIAIPISKGVGYRAKRMYDLGNFKIDIPKNIHNGLEGEEIRNGGC